MTLAAALRNVWYLVVSFFVWLAFLLLPPGRGAVSEAFDGSRRLRERSSPRARAVGSPRSRLALMFESPPSETFVVCHGPQVCLGEERIGGVRTCKDGLYCEEGAVLLWSDAGEAETGGGEQGPASPDDEAEDQADEERKPEDEGAHAANTDTDLAEMDAMVDGEPSATDLSGSVTEERLYSCSGLHECGAWEEQEGRLVCGSEYSCLLGDVASDESLRLVALPGKGFGQGSEKGKSSKGGSKGHSTGGRGGHALYFVESATPREMFLAGGKGKSKGVGKGASKGHAGGKDARAFDVAEREASAEMLLTAGKGKGKGLGKGASKGHAGGKDARAFDAAELEASPGMFVTASKGKGKGLGKGVSTGHAGKDARGSDVVEFNTSIGGKGPGGGGWEVKHVAAFEASPETFPAGGGKAPMLEASPEMLVTAGKGKGKSIGKGASTGHAGGKDARGFDVAGFKASPEMFLTAGKGKGKGLGKGASKGHAGGKDARAFDAAELEASGEGNGRR